MPKDNEKLTNYILNDFKVIIYSQCKEANEFKEYYEKFIKKYIMADMFNVSIGKIYPPFSKEYTEPIAFNYYGPIILLDRIRSSYLESRKEYPYLNYGITSNIRASLVYIKDKNLHILAFDNRESINKNTIEEIKGELVKIVNTAYKKITELINDFVKLDSVTKITILLSLFIKPEIADIRTLNLKVDDLNIQGKTDNAIITINMEEDVEISIALSKYNNNVVYGISYMNSKARKIIKEKSFKKFIIEQISKIIDEIKTNYVELK